MVEYIYGCGKHLTGEPNIWYISIYTNESTDWWSISHGGRVEYLLLHNCGDAGGTGTIKLPVMRLCKDCSRRYGILW